MSALDKLTPEQREKIRAEAQAVRDRAMGRVVTVPRTPSVKKFKSTTHMGASRKGIKHSKPRPPKLSRERVKELWDQGLMVREIAERLGAHRSTVSVALTELGVDSRKGPRTRQKVCHRGHDMSEHWRPSPSGRGGGYCSECKRLRQRVSWKKKGGEE